MVKPTQYTTGLNSPENKVAKSIVDEYERGVARQANIRNLWQLTADRLYPYIQITSKFTPGTERTDEIFDVTPMLDMWDMVAGFKQVLVPQGQKFYVIEVGQELQKNDRAQRYLSMLAEISHKAIFASNFNTQIDRVLMNGIAFGPMTMYTEWKKGIGLNYKVPDVGSYIIFEDDSHNVIGGIYELCLTARQAFNLYGENAGKTVLQKVEKPDHEHDEVKFLYKVCKRQRDFSRALDMNTNMPYGAWVVNKEDKHLVQVGGFNENPYATARWMRPGREIDGRGIGTELLPQIKILFQMSQDLLEVGEKWAKPPKQALTDGVEGQIRTGPNAITWVTQIDALRSQDQTMNGNFPITVEELDRQTKIIDRAFFKQAFDPLTDLKGDRRTTLEIQERIRGTLKKLGPPVNRIWYELLTKVIERSILELIRNRQVPPPPPELAGSRFGIDYVGPLALALKSEQARGFQEWINFIGAAAQVFPNENLGDNIDFDDAIPRIGRTFGVNEEDIASEDQIAAKRVRREQMLQAQQQVMAAQAMAKAAKDGSTAPEAGSPTAALMGEQ